MALEINPNSNSVVMSHIVGFDADERSLPYGSIGTGEDYSAESMNGGKSEKVRINLRPGWIFAKHSISFVVMLCAALFFFHIKSMVIVYSLSISSVVLGYMHRLVIIGNVKSKENALQSIIGLHPRLKFKPVNRKW